MNKSQTSAKQNPSVVCTQLQNGDSVLLHLETQTYYSLNSTGVFIWECLEDSDKNQEIAQKLAAKYDVSLEDANNSVNTLLQELTQEELVLAP